MHSQQPPGVVQNRSTLQCSKQNTEQCGYDHAPVTWGRMRAQFPLPHGPSKGTCQTPHLRAAFTQSAQCKVCTLLEIPGPNFQVFSSYNETIAQGGFKRPKVSCCMFLKTQPNQTKD